MESVPFVIKSVKSTFSGRFGTITGVNSVYDVKVESLTLVVLNKELELQKEGCLPIHGPDLNLFLNVRGDARELIIVLSKLLVSHDRRQ